MLLRLRRCRDLWWAGTDERSALMLQVVEQVVLEIAVGIERSRARLDRLVPEILGRLAVEEEAGQGQRHQPARRGGRSPRPPRPEAGGRSEPGRARAGRETDIDEALKPPGQARGGKSRRKRSARPAPAQRHAADECQQRSQKRRVGQGQGREDARRIDEHIGHRLGHERNVGQRSWRQGKKREVPPDPEKVPLAHDRA